MGHAILYCSSCSMQLREPDFEKGAAFRADGRAYCKACAPEEVRSRPPVPERRPEMLSPGTSRIMYVAPPSGSGTGAKPGRTAILIAAGIGIMGLLLAAVSFLGQTPHRAASEPAPPPLVRPPETAPHPAPAPAPSPPPAPKD